jgi:hypothetical protein
MQRKALRAAPVILWLALTPFVLAAQSVDVQPTDAAPQAETTVAVPTAPVVADPARLDKARTTADHILARREFRRVKQPGFEASLQDRFVKALLNFLDKLFGSRLQLRLVGTIIYWAVILAAVALLLLFIMRILQSSLLGTLSLEPGLLSVSSIPWQEWRRLAEEAAAQGLFRDAVHFGYWAAIAALEQRGAWKPDRARTPREYLRLARAAAFYPQLNELTRTFERVWYAQQPASEADFIACRSQLEALGCQ